MRPGADSKSRVGGAAQLAGARRRRVPRGGGSALARGTCIRHGRARPYDLEFTPGQDVANPLQIDLFYAPHCSACRRIRPRLRRLASSDQDTLLVRELDVLEHLDEAVAAGVRCPPSLVVEGRVRLAGAFSESTLTAFLKELRSRRTE